MHPRDRLARKTRYMYDDMETVNYNLSDADNIETVDYNLSDAETAQYDNTEMQQISSRNKKISKQVAAKKIFKKCDRVRRKKK